MERNLEDAVRQAVFEQQKLVGEEKGDQQSFASQRAAERWVALRVFGKYIRPTKRGPKAIKGFTLEEAKRLGQILLNWAETDRRKKELAYEICRAFSPLGKRAMTASSALTTAKHFVETRGISWKTLTSFQRNSKQEIPLNETSNEGR